VSGSDKAKRVLIAPIPVTPTKPLTPSHLKGMLWVDVMLKTTTRFAKTDCLYSNLTANGSEQTLGFWEFLDREQPNTNWQSCTEDEIGELYVRYHSQQPKPPYSALLPYLRAVEQNNWIHPASANLHKAWSSQATLLKARDPGFSCASSAAMPLELLLQCLREMDLCIDLRNVSGPVYLDATAEGLPLRPVITPEGRANYLVSLLRDLVPQISNYEQIILVHDQELTADYVLLQRILMRLGAVVDRVAISRVAIDGIVQSTRFGGWKGYTASDLISACLKNADLPSFQLGMRLYFIAVVGKGLPRSFSMQHLQRSIGRAHQLIYAATAGEKESTDTFLLKCQGRKNYIDPYRVTSSLLSRGHLHPPLAGELAEWYM
jgi:hypothetical protein